MSNTAPQSQGSRIAIKFGASSGGTKATSSGTKRLGQPPSALGKRQRPNALHNDSDSGDEEDTIGKHEVVTTIGSGVSTTTNNGLPVAKRQTKEYVISSLKNHDWRADIKGRKGDKVSVARTSFSSQDHSVETAPADQDRDVKWGLNIKEKSTQGTLPGPGDDKLGQHENSASEKATESSPPQEDGDKEAMNALLGKTKPAQDLVISHLAVKSKPQFSEKDAYQRSIQEAADVSTIEEYSDIPEGEFGAAMLRGMGWKGEEFGSKPKEVKRRPHLMGLGSKEDEEIRKAELAKRHGHRERRPRLDEYRRDREKEKHERDGRYRDSYKSERDRERREQSQDYRSKDRYREHSHHSHRSRG
jgi:hypothetical protein